MPFASATVLFAIGLPFANKLYCFAGSGVGSVGVGSGASELPVSPVLELSVVCWLDEVAAELLATVLLSSAKACCEANRVGPKRLPSANRLTILLYFISIPHF